jgi:hypothetical protein
MHPPSLQQVLVLNDSRDICHYCQGKMNSQTIEENMMFLCTSKFDMEEKKAKYLEQFFSHIEIQAVKEEKPEKLGEVQVDAISDTEEQDDEANDQTRQDEVGEPELPVAEKNTQIRASGRKRKSRDDDVFESYSKW